MERHRALLDQTPRRAQKEGGTRSRRGDARWGERKNKGQLKVGGRRKGRLGEEKVEEIGVV